MLPDWGIPEQSNPIIFDSNIHDVCFNGGEYFNTMSTCIPNDFSPLIHINNSLSPCLLQEEINVENKMKEESTIIAAARSAAEGGLENKRNKREVGIGKCTHFKCQVTETPLWRRGPLGPRTLCNACGIKYGRQRAKDPNIGVEFLQNPEL